MNSFQNSQHPGCSLSELPDTSHKMLRSRVSGFTHSSSRGASSGYETVSLRNRIFGFSHSSSRGASNGYETGSNPLHVNNPQNPHKPTSSYPCLRDRMLDSLLAKCRTPAILCMVCGDCVVKWKPSGALRAGAIAVTSIFRSLTLATL